MESFILTLKTERIKGKTYRSRNPAHADVFDYTDQFYNPVPAAIRQRIPEPYRL